MAPIHKVAVIQLYPKPLQPDLNFAKAADFIRKTASQGVQLAVLPEYHLTNWVPQDPKFSELCGQWETYLKKYQTLAKELKICIVPGTIVELHKEAEDEEDKLLNVAYFIGPDGGVLGRYEKKNLWHPERPHLTSSQHDPHPVFQTPFGVCGMLICWDLAFPEGFRELIGQGARIVIIPTFWTHSDCSEYGLSKNPMAEKLFLESTLNSRAYENTCAVIFVNAGGPVGSTGRGTYAGLSRVTMPFLGALGDETKDSEEEGMSIIDIDMEVLDEAEKNYKVREDMGRADWHYTYRHDNFGEKGPNSLGKL